MTIRYNSESRITGIPSHIAFSCILLTRELVDHELSVPSVLLLLNSDIDKNHVECLKKLLQENHPDVFHKTFDLSSLVSEESAFKRPKVEDVDDV